MPEIKWNVIYSDPINYGAESQVFGVYPVCFVFSIMQDSITPLTPNRPLNYILTLDMVEPDGKETEVGYVIAFKSKTPEEAMAKAENFFVNFKGNLNGN